MSHSTNDVSVVIPCFRCSETIERAVTSVSLQSERPRELILVDDGSGESTVCRIRELESRAAGWIRLIELNRNQGPGAARNAGWAAATQPLVAFLDADDTWHPHKLALQARWMTEHPETSLSGHRWLFAGAEAPTDVDRASGASVSFNQLLWRNRFATPTVMLRRELPFRFPQEQRHSEDYALWLEIAAAGGKMDFLQGPISYLHKLPFDRGGLSADSRLMLGGELRNYRRLRTAGKLSSGTCLSVFALAWVRHARRCMIQALRRS
jgi:glycosyltransferase involved in cell wall biosynthesis